VAILTLTLLAPGDEAELERFLIPRADSSMILLGNSRTAGLVDRGERFQATYVAAREDGTVVAVAAHCWNGNLVLQGRADALVEAARSAVERTGREIGGFLGPVAQVEAVRAAFGLTDRSAMLDSREDLMTLALTDLRVPPPLADGRWLCRHPRAEDAATLAEWDFDYGTEALGAAPSRERPAPTPFRESPSGWVLVADGALVAQCGFTAELPDRVQIGGVYTPPPLRNRGYARAVVAGALVGARARGVTHAILFTENPAARAAYAAIGFRVVGDYALVVFNR
jgi:RimJ/RimL family protein N-acetyltransferase